ncbi:oxidoreductase [Bisporella sp. PMI_857]|nr:oxidoreductase [Bisporella sp. PMI_857]
MVTLIPLNKGHQPPTQQQEHPGLEKQMEPKPIKVHLPTEDNGYQIYKAAGKLVGKKTLITGGDSGIGRAIAILFAMEGAEVAISYLPAEEEDAQHTKAQVEKNGGRIYLFQADLSHANNCKNLVQKAVDALGGLNILINNAAYQTTKKDIGDINEDQWIHTFNTNIHAYFFLAKYALPHMEPGDTIINTTSVTAYTGTGPALDYISTKGAIVAFTRALSSQQVNNGIRVNAVAPGPVWTPLVVSTMDKKSLSQLGSTPMGRPGQPSEIAACYVFLASQDSSFISGQVLHPNGGSIVNG